MRDFLDGAVDANRLLPIDVQGLTLVANGGERLIDNVSFALRDSSLTVIMGPNGAGKSVLLRLLHGLLQPTSGVISFGGQALDDEIRKRQALVFQRPVLLRRSVAANLDFALKLRGPIDRDGRDALLDQVGLLDKSKQAARLLSGGEQQRLALARALAMDPEVLFLDEPTASLDPASTALIEEIAQNVQAGGSKVVFVTHDIGQARRLADEVLFFSRGCLTEQRPVDQFFAGPASEPAKAYLEGRLNP